jgi:hypothetical protein
MRETHEYRVLYEENQVAAERELNKLAREGFRLHWISAGPTPHTNHNGDITGSDSGLWMVLIREIEDEKEVA